MTLDDNNVIIPFVLRFSNWRRNTVQKQYTQGYIKRQRSIAEIFVFNYIPSALTSSLLAPFNRVKVILQVQNFIPGVEKLSVKEAFSKIIKDDGLSSLFRGNLIYSAKILSGICAKTILFDRFKNRTNYLKDQIKTLKYKIFGINFLLDTICAVFASTVSLLMTYPFDLAYGRVAGQLKNDKKANLPYKNMKDCFHFSEDAAKTDFFFMKYYHGISAAIAQSIVFSSITLIGFQILFRIKKEGLENKKKSNSFLNLLGGPSIVALIASVAAYPLDTIKREMQVNGAKGFKSQYTDVIYSLQAKRQAGFAEAYKGFSMHLVRTIPYAPMQYMIFSSLTKLITAKNEKKKNHENKNK